jgi:hypothetical protein
MSGTVLLLTGVTTLTYLTDPEIAPKLASGTRAELCYTKWV